MIATTHYFWNNLRTDSIYTDNLQSKLRLTLIFVNKTTGYLGNNGLFKSKWRRPPSCCTALLANRRLFSPLAEASPLLTVPHLKLFRKDPGNEVCHLTLAPDLGNPLNSPRSPDPVNSGNYYSNSTVASAPCAEAVRTRAN